MVSVEKCEDRPREQHEVEAVCPVPLSFVEGRSLLHQVLQVSGIHLQPPDHVVHVALVVLVMNVTEDKWKSRRKWGEKNTQQHISQSFDGIKNPPLSTFGEKKLPDDFAQSVFYLLEIRSFFWVLIPTAFYQHVHLGERRHKPFKNYQTVDTIRATQICINSPLLPFLNLCQSSGQA